MCYTTTIIFYPRKKTLKHHHLIKKNYVNILVFEQMSRNKILNAFFVQSTPFSYPSYAIFHYLPCVSMLSEFRNRTAYHYFQIRNTVRGPITVVFFCRRRELLEYTDHQEPVFETVYTSDVQSIFRSFDDREMRPTAETATGASGGRPRKYVL